MGEWVKTTLGDVITLQRGHDLPKSKMLDGNIPVAGSNGIIGYHNTPTTKALGVTIGRSGNLGNAYLYKTDFWAHNTTLYVKDFKSNDALFVYYLLKNINFKSFNVGSAVPTLNRNHIHPLEISLPPLPEQKAIAEVLSSLDDKIDLLHRQNKTLEAMAETLFRQWFVEEAKDDWKTVCIADVAKTNISTVKGNYAHQEILYLDTGSITEGKIEALQSYELKNAPSRAKRLVKHNDIIVSTVRPNHKHYGFIQNPVDNLVVSTGFCVISCTTINPNFMYSLLTQEDMIEYLSILAEASTSTYPSLKPSDIETIEFKIPPNDLLEKFGEIISDNWRKIGNNYKHIHTLESLRDTLLPKLMNGVIRLKI